MRDRVCTRSKLDMFLIQTIRWVTAGPSLGCFGGFLPRRVMDIGPRTYAFHIRSRTPKRPWRIEQLTRYFRSPQTWGKISPACCTMSMISTFGLFVVPVSAYKQYVQLLFQRIVLGRASGNLRQGWTKDESNINVVCVVDHTHGFTILTIQKDIQWSSLSSSWSYEWELCQDLHTFLQGFAIVNIKQGQCLQFLQFLTQIGGKLPHSTPQDNHWGKSFRDIRPSNLCWLQA